MPKGRDKRPSIARSPSGNPIRTAASPSGRTVRVAADPDSILNESPVWAFSLFDWDGRWGIKALSECDWRKHIQTHLVALERATWGDLMKAAGGRRAGTNHHYLARDDLSANAQKRWDDLDLPAEEIFSLRLEARVRLYGIREGRVFRALWVDPWHDDARKAVCPSMRR